MKFKIKLKAEIYKIDEKIKYNTKIAFLYLRNEYKKHFGKCGIQKSFEELFNDCKDDMLDIGFYKQIDFQYLLNLCKINGFEDVHLFNGIDSEGKVFNYIMFNKIKYTRTIEEEE